MNVEEANKILEDESDNWSLENEPKVQCDLLEGMKIIAESLKDAEYISSAAEHDVFYYGDFEKSVANLTEDQIRYLAKLGWREEYDSWTSFV